MHAIYSATAEQLFILREIANGHRFTPFCDQLIRGQATKAGVNQSHIHTNIRSIKQDGGVDTQVDFPLTDQNGNEPTGFLQEKTIWQYKACEFSDLKQKQAALKKEIEEASYAVECIKEGYAYRLCVCDSLPPPAKKEWEEWLNAIITSINPKAPLAKIVTAEELAYWANSFPIILGDFLGVGIINQGLLLSSWGNIATATTREYVAISNWQTVQSDLLRHIDLSIPCTDIVFAVVGDAGAGKTRMVYETLKQIESSSGLVAYTVNEDVATRIATYLLNNDHVMAILVIDECTNEQRYELKNTLKGCKDRVRLVTIGIGTEQGLANEYSLPKMDLEQLDVVLEKNFPLVQPEQRKAYAHLAGGYVRLATVMCENDAQIQAKGGLIPPSVTEYLESILSKEQLEVVQAISLLSKVGYRGEVEKELLALCAYLHLDKDQVFSIANQLHEPPGFIARGGRYFYVTPEAVAQATFQGAWNRWVKDDESGFLEDLPSLLWEPFMRRVSKLDNSEVRRIVGNHFLRWATSLSPADLLDLTRIERLAKLAEIDPETFFPVVRRLVEDATPEELSQTTPKYGPLGGPRRELVRLCAELSAFGEYFVDVEAVSRKLALSETEPRLGNNATNTWKGLFKIVLSGTPIPFLQRLKLLHEAALSENNDLAEMALSTLGIIFDTHETATGRSPVIAGRIPPSQWQPATNLEYKQCFDSIVNVLEELATHHDPLLKERALKLVIKLTSYLLRWGYFNSYKRMVEDSDLVTKSSVLSAVDTYLHFDSEHADESTLKKMQLIRDWAQTLRPTDLHSRTVAQFAVEQFRWYAHEGETQKKVEQLATDLFLNTEVLDSELAWLSSEEAKEPVSLGMELGKLDDTASLLPKLIDSLATGKNTALCRGYFYVNATTHPKNLGLINSALDGLEVTHPDFAYTLSLTARRPLNSLDRTLRMVDSAKLPVDRLRLFGFGTPSDMLTAKEFQDVLARLVNASRDGNERALSTVLEFIGGRANEEEKGNAEPTLDVPEVRAQIWEVLERKIPESTIVAESHWWLKILKHYANTDPDKAAKVAADALLMLGITAESEPIEILLAIGKQNPQTVLSNLSRLIHNEEKGYRFFIGQFSFLFQGLPTDAVMQWLEHEGVETARIVARHLPRPYLDEQGNPIVPNLTEKVLTMFESDDRVFGAFCAGGPTEIITGSLAAHKESEIKVAAKFLHHRTRRIREWAANEVEYGKKEAKQWTQWEEELFIDEK